MHSSVHRGAVLLLGAGLALALAGAAVAVEITVAEPYPLRGAPTTLSVTDGGQPLAGAEVVVEYRPNSEIASTETLAPTTADGTVDWTPRDAGIVTLTVTAGERVTTRDVAVRFGGFPPSGLLIMLIACALLFGGAIFGFTLLMRSSAKPQSSPST